MVTIQVKIDAEKLRSKLKAPTLTQAALSRVFSTLCNELIENKTALIAYELNELRTNPKTYGRTP